VFIDPFVKGQPFQSPVRTVPENGRLDYLAMFRRPGKSQKMRGVLDKILANDYFSSV
jgi:hypothetical protein